MRTCTAIASLLLAASLGGCLSPPVRPAPRDGLKAAYDAMSQAMAAGADDYAHADLEIARSRYNLGVAQLQQDETRAQQLAEESMVAAQLAQAKTEAAHAAQQRALAQNEVDEIENMAKPPEVIEPTRRIRR